MLHSFCDGKSVFAHLCGSGHIHLNICLCRAVPNHFEKALKEDFNSWEKMTQILPKNKPHFDTFLGQ